MLFINRYNLKDGKIAEFRRWILESRDTFEEGCPEGWHYLGTYLTVRWLGQFDVETHWELDDYGVLGAGFGDEAFQALLAQWLGFIDGQVQACLLKSAEEIQIPAGG